MADGLKDIASCHRLLVCKNFKSPDQPGQSSLLNCQNVLLTAFCWVIEVVHVTLCLEEECAKRVPVIIQ